MTKGEEPVCPHCGYPTRINEHAQDCLFRKEVDEKGNRTSTDVPPTKEADLDSEPADPYGPEAIRRDIKHKANKIREWGERLGLKEGKDYLIVENVGDFAGEDYRIAPHEAKAFAIGVLEPHYKIFREYILGQYKTERKQENPKGDVKLYYSWGGRFLVGWDGVPFDTVAMESVDPPRAPTHHEEFKSFFKERYDFDFPTSEVLNPILKEISQKSLGKYAEASEKLKSMRDDETLPDDGYGLIDSLEHAMMILRDATDGDALVDLPEIIEGSMQDKMAHYADLTYNASSVADYDRVSKITGVTFSDEARLDKLFDRWGFDRNKMKEVCHEFADYLDRAGRKNG